MFNENNTIIVFLIALLHHLKLIMSQVYDTIEKAGDSAHYNKGNNCACCEEQKSHKHGGVIFIKMLQQVDNKMYEYICP